MKSISLTIICLLFPALSIAANQTYQDTIKGKVCKETRSQQIECDYKIGKNLNIAIAGVGLPDTSISFYSSKYEGDYFARVGILHGCVIIVPGESSDRFSQFGNLAFISPKNGKVYESWQSCQNGY